MEAQYVATNRWEAWIHVGPASGVKRQHQFSRNATGWTPTNESSGKVYATHGQDELDDLDGLSADELDAIRFDQGEKGTPASAQQEADDQAPKWQEQWGGPGSPEERKWPKEMGEEMEDVLVEELSEACNIFPNETGLG